MVAIGIAELMVIAVGLSMMVLPLVALVLIFTQPKAAWKASGQVRWLWVLLVLLLPVLGAIAYLLVAHRDVARATHLEVGMAH